MEEFLLSWGLPVGCGTSANCPVANLYTITSIDAAVDLTTGVWVEAVATVGEGPVGVVVVGTGWARTLTLYPLLVIMVLFLLSLALGPGAFLAIGLEFWGQVLVLGCGWIGHGWVCWGLGLGPNLPSNSKYVFIFQMREVRMEPCTTGVALDDL